MTAAHSFTPERIAELKRTLHLPGVDEARESEVRDALVTVPRIIATIAWTRVTDAVEVPVKLRGSTRVSMDVWREQEAVR